MLLILTAMLKGKRSHFCFTDEKKDVPKVTEKVNGRARVDPGQSDSKALIFTLSVCSQIIETKRVMGQVQEEIKVLKFKTILADKENASRPTGAKII